MNYKIAISGSYGGLNLGDEAILEVILRELRASIDAEIVVFSRNPEDTQKRHKTRAIPIREMHKDEIFKELKELDLLILGGGGILFDGEAEKFLRDVNWAIELGVPVMVYAISAGPFKAPEVKKLVADTLNKVQVITVREGEAKKILQDIGVTQNIEVTADPALLLEEQPFTRDMLEKKGFDLSIPIVGFSVREPGNAAPDLNVEQYHDVLANAADFIVERTNSQILFVPMEHREHKDISHAHAIVARMANASKATVLKGEYQSGEILGLVKQMAFVVGMRLHLLIFSAIQHVPFVPLPYASKVKGFLADLNMPMNQVMELNPGTLCAFLDRSWDNRTSIKQKLEERIPLLKEKSKRTNQILCDFLCSLPAKK